MEKGKLKKRFFTGSAFILVVMLTTLLALIGIVFLMTSRVDTISTSAIAENKQLDAAVDTIISQISEQLVADTPRIDIDPNDVLNQEYYDYPDEWNSWLANLEPIDVGGYRWHQISDIYNVLGPDATDLEAAIIADYIADILPNDVADADGDGVADSRWVIVPDMATNKGEAVFAAVRIVDNGGMLNVNTAYKFDPLAEDVNINDIDGTSQLQVNLAELSQRGSNGTLGAAANKLHFWRCNDDISTTLQAYENNVIWRYVSAVSGFTPFDISDELKLRNRYIINYNDIITRIEELWEYAYERGPRTPLPTNDYPYSRWPNCVTLDAGVLADYDYKHISTIYNLDRIINPYGFRMINVNELDAIDPAVLYTAVYNGLRDGGVDPSELDALAGQITVNLKDYSDDNSNMTVFGAYAGFETPCIFISELAYTYLIDPDNANNIYHSYSIEVSKHFPADEIMNDNFELVLPNMRINLNDFARDKSKYYVLVLENSKGSLISDDVHFFDSPGDGEENVDPDVILWWPLLWDTNSAGYDVYLGTDYKSVKDANNTVITQVPFVPLWPEYKGKTPVNWYDPPGSLITGITYYWRIDDVNIGGRVIFKGPVWSFTVGDPKPDVKDIGVNKTAFVANDIIRIDRILPGGAHVVVDEVAVDVNLFDEEYYGMIVSFQREMSEQKFIKRLWAGPFTTYTLGHYNADAQLYFSDDPKSPGPEPSKPIPVYFDWLRNIGELGKVFWYDIYKIPQYPLSKDMTEINVRINLNNTDYQNLFNYLTVIDPAYYVADANETRIQGRININTAPWYVIAQLPWVSNRPDYLQPLQSYNSSQLAEEIVINRDTEGPYRSIGQLNSVYGMQYFIDEKDQFWYPDLSTYARTRNDDSADDFEEKDLIFTRMSDLVTVRSDVFTAYILVRLGQNGPQKRVIAVLDRSGVFTAAGKVKVRALYEVPEAR